MRMLAGDYQYFINLSWKHTGKVLYSEEPSDVFIG